MLNLWDTGAHLYHCITIFSTTNKSYLPNRQEFAVSGKWVPSVPFLLMTTISPKRGIFSFGYLTCKARIKVELQLKKIMSIYGRYIIQQICRGLWLFETAIYTDYQVSCHHYSEPSVSVPRWGDWKRLSEASGRPSDAQGGCTQPPCVSEHLTDVTRSQFQSCLGDPQGPGSAPALNQIGRCQTHGDMEGTLLLQ